MNPRGGETSRDVSPGGAAFSEASEASACSVSDASDDASKPFAVSAASSSASSSRLEETSRSKKRSPALFFFAAFSFFFSAPPPNTDAAEPETKRIADASPPKDEGASGASNAARFSSADAPSPSAVPSESVPGSDPRGGVFPASFFSTSKFTATVSVSPFNGSERFSRAVASAAFSSSCARRALASATPRSTAASISAFGAAASRATRSSGSEPVTASSRSSSPSSSDQTRNAWWPSIAMSTGMRTSSVAHGSSSASSEADASSSSPPSSCASAPVSNALIIRSSCVHGASATRSSPRFFPATDPEPEKSVSFLRVSSSNGFFDSAQGEGANPRGVPANTPASNSASHDALKSLASASRRLAVACAAASQPAPPGVNGCCVVAPRTKSAGAPRRRRSAPRAVSRHPTATSSSSSEAAVSSVSSVSSLCAAFRARS
mmetsp:Transcript_4142/g.17571  ORF Transcript_4142/g.17571 Transcript_4142/m.17571 type:complete len:436 (-) Transcript_4142:432-1739(-)